MNRLQLAALLLVLAIFSTGCHKKRPKAQPPTQAQTVPQQPTTQIPLPQIPTPPQITPTETTPDQTPAPPPPQKKPAHKTIRKPKPATIPEPAKTAAATPPPAISSPEPQITTSTSVSDAERQSKDLLDDSDASVNRLTKQRAPTPDEVITIQQIRSYEKDAQDALRQKDFSRAYTLAQKAHLLAVTLRP